MVAVLILISEPMESALLSKVSVHFPTHCLQVLSPPSASLPVHYSRFMRTVDASQPQLLTVSLNKPSLHAQSRNEEHSLMTEVLIVCCLTGLSLT